MLMACWSHFGMYFGWEGVSSNDNKSDNEVSGNICIEGNEY